MTQEIVEAFERCQRRYPTIQLSLEVFQARVNDVLSRICSVEEQSQASTRIHYEDLFLATACSRDDRIAWEYFADDYMPIIRRFAAQACGDSVEAEDLAQEVTAKMLREKNRLAGYNGNGSLAGWLRVAVSHAAVDRFRRRRGQVSLDELQESGMQAGLSNGTKEDGEDLDSRWGPVVSGIANETISGLPARDRLLLGLHYLRGLSLKTIGRQFGVHEATASRWLERLRREIRKRVEHELRKKYGLRTGEIQSLWRFISIPSVVDPIAEASSLATGANAGNAVEDMDKKPARRID